eukprot:161766-Prymnesium_polylepis.1
MHDIPSKKKACCQKSLGRCRSIPLNPTKSRRTAKSQGASAACPSRAVCCVPLVEGLLSFVCVFAW